MKRLNILTTTHVYPSSVLPNVGAFIKNRTQYVSDLTAVKVIAPAPYFPFAEKLWANYRPQMPILEKIGNLDVYHPKFLTVPGIGISLNSLLYFMSVYSIAKKIQRDYQFDIIDAHFVHPDGVGAALLGAALKIPVVITLRGSITRLSRSFWIRPQIKWALKSASRIIAVSSYLKGVAQDLNIPSDKIDVIPNGIDTNIFYLENKIKCRNKLGLDESSKILISVGRIVEWKGYHRIIEVMPELMSQFGNLHYIIVGGPGTTKDFTSEIYKQINKLGLQNNVSLVGEKQSTDIRQYLNASDLFCLATRGEGWSNVITESIACGLPVVATNVGGNKEIIYNDDLGYLVDYGNSVQLKKAIRAALFKNWDRKKIAMIGSKYSWYDVGQSVIQTYQSALKNFASRS